MQNFCMKVSLSFRKPVKVANLENVNETKFIHNGQNYFCLQKLCFME